MGSSPQAILLWHKDASVAVNQLRCSAAACAVLVPWPRVKPMSPALQARFSTREVPLEHFVTPAVTTLTFRYNHLLTCPSCVQTTQHQEEWALSRYLPDLLNDIFISLTKHLLRVFFPFCPLWKIKKRKSQLKWVSGRPVKWALTCYYHPHHLHHQLPQTGSINYPAGKTSVTDCNRKRCTLHSQTGSALLYYVSKRKTSLCPSNRPSQKKML